MQYTEDTPLIGSKNIASRLSHGQKALLASQTADLWRNTRDHQLSEYINDSREAWDFMNNNKPQGMRNLNEIATGAAAMAPGRKIRLGKIPEVVRALLSIQHRSTFNNDDRFFKGQPLDEFSKENMGVVERYYEQQFGEQNINIKWLLHRMNTIVDGTAASMCHWEKKTRETTTYKPIILSLPGLTSMRLGTWEKTGEVVEYQATTLRNLNFNDWVGDPASGNLDDSFFIRRYYKPTHWVEDTYNLEKGSVSTYGASNETDDTDTVKETLGIDNIRPSITYEETEGKRFAMLMVRYDDFVIDGKRYYNHCLLTLNDKDVLFFGPNDYNHGRKPVLVTPYLPMPNSLYGQSAVKHVIPAAEALDSFVDISIDVGKRGVLDVHLVNSRETYFQKSENLIVRPGMTIPVQDMNSVKAMDKPMPNVQFVQYMAEMLTTFIQNNTGATPVFSGENPQGSNVTAFQVSQHVQGGSIQFETLIEVFNAHGVEPFMQMVHSNAQQFFEGEEEVADNNKTITSDLLRGVNCKWHLVGVTATENRNRHISQIQQLLGEIGPMGREQGWLVYKEDGVTEFDPNAAFKILLEQSKFPDAEEVAQYVTNAELQATRGFGANPQDAGAIDPTTGLPMAGGQLPPVGGQPLPPEFDGGGPGIADIPAA